ncbi:MAG TPA: sigma-54 dependent transcriptional regulator [Terriglobales bacterium]|nr:sigma-54 dependent transcriptional regulator [Terriglobales bacterium]
MHAIAATTFRAPDPRRITIVSNDTKLQPEIQQYLEPYFEVRLLDCWSQLAVVQSETSLDAVLLDLDAQGMPAANALELLTRLRGMNRDLILIAFTRSQDQGLRLTAAKVPVDGFFAGPLDFREVQLVLDRALEKRAMEVENRRVTEQISGRFSFCELIGGSEPIRRVYDAILRVAQSDVTVVIRGESGTGKELVARSIVTLGPRGEKPFISLNCAALPEALIDSELFGHEKGAFTGAHASRPGQIELADGGTLFLDEIATLGMELQTKLLRVLESHTVQRLGGRTTKRVDFRLLTATNENLEEMVRNGRFREDLYYRIHVVPIFIPPLRERREDIPLLVDHFLRLYCATNRLPLKRIDPEVIEILEEYTWKGNVRELENLMQRLVLMVQGPAILPKDLPQQLLYHSTAKQESLLIPEGGIDFDEEIARIEVAYLQAALHLANGKKVGAAAMLHIDPQKMKYLCRKYNI